MTPSKLKLDIRDCKEVLESFKAPRDGTPQFFQFVGYAFGPRIRIPVQKMVPMLRSYLGDLEDQLTELETQIAEGNKRQQELKAHTDER